MGEHQRLDQRLLCAATRLSPSPRDSTIVARMSPRAALVLKIALPLIFLFLPGLREVLYDFIGSPRVLQSTTRWIKWALATEIIFAALAWVVYRPKTLEDFGQLLLWTIVSSALSGSTAFEWINCLGDTSPATIVDVGFVPRSGRAITFRVVSGTQAGLEFQCNPVTWGPIGIAKHHLELRRGRLGVWWGKLLPLTN